MVSFARALSGLLMLSSFAAAAGNDNKNPAEDATARSAAGKQAAAAPAALILRPGDHICLVGNALAERMQHEGWLEAMIYGRFPNHELSLRNLGFAADELTVRQRSDGFGTPDEWLARTEADVVFAFFGFNESFAGPQGLDAFRSDLQGFIRNTLQQRYSPRGPTRLVLFSPIAHEDRHDRNLPDGRGSNARLAQYAAAMADVARGEGVLYVDLFGASQRLYQDSKSPLSINGIHLNSVGDRLLAAAIDEALFGKPAVEIEPSRLEAIRRAVLDKNFYWFHRYRTTDGYSTYGGRSYLKFVNNQTNREVLMRELEILDRMTANRDRNIWSLLSGDAKKYARVDLLPLLDVVTNKPGPGPGGKHLFLSGEEAIGQMKLADGLKVNLYASEEQFPELIKPAQMAWDTKGRLWVGAWPSYPHWRPGDEMNDRLLILEDTDGDGRADRCKTFADHLHNPTGFEFWGGGVIVAMAPDLLFLKDTDGDDRAEVRERILHGIDSADTHHTANSFTLGPDGALYFQEGLFHRTQIETPYGPLRNRDACVWRFEPRTWKVERYVPYGFANPHGHVFDAWGRDIVYDGTGANPYDAALFSGFVEFPRQHGGAPQVYRQRTRPCPAAEFLSSRHFPESMQGNLLVANVIGFLGILQYQITEDGSSLEGKEVEPIITSSDPNFRPADLEIGPDGALYFTDWQNPIIGHMQHNLRDPSRDHLHGRVYRVTHQTRPLTVPAKIAGEPIEKLLDLLKDTDDRVRYRARIELSDRDPQQVVEAVKKWLAALDRKDLGYERLALESLWVHQQCNMVNLELLQQVLKSSDHRARAAATRVLCQWRDRHPDSLGRLRQLAADPQPRVRLEAARAASFLTAPEAFEVALLAGQPSADKFLSYTITETLQTLQPHWKRALATGAKIPTTTEAGRSFLLRQMSVDQLLSFERTRPGFLEALCRGGVDDADRAKALAALAELEHRTRPEALLDAIAQLDAEDHPRDPGSVADLVRLLMKQEAAELAGVRPTIERLAGAARQPLVRRAALAALVGVDRSADKAWSFAAKSPESLRDMVAAVPLVSDLSLRGGLYPRVQSLLTGPPAELAAANPDAAASLRFAAMDVLPSFRGKEQEVFLTLARSAIEGHDRTAAVNAMRKIPTQFWPKDQARPLADLMIAELRAIPQAGRTSQAGLAAMQFADSLASLLPVNEARQVRATLRGLGVRVIHVAAVRERMSYDKEALVLQAGQPVEIVFENPDLMPHNLVITAPGALEELGLLAESTAQQPGAAERHYVPRSKKVLASTPLLQSGQSHRLSFVAPKAAGVYPYVCTYPGHWRRMFGSLYVVDDLDEYEADPEKYLAARPLKIVDELLKNHRPRVEWKPEDLESDVSRLSGGRSFEVGKQMFQVASCTSCHRLNGEGQTFGPDLTKLDPPRTRQELLRDVLDPSVRIDDKYRSQVFQTDEGKTITGMVVEETDAVVRVIENPLLATDVIALPKSHITERARAATSIMPKGLLDRLSREEILDLIAYVSARGERNNELFQGGNGHDHHGQ